MSREYILRVPAHVRQFAIDLQSMHANQNYHLDLRNTKPISLLHDITILNEMMHATQKFDMFERSRSIKMQLIRNKLNNL